MTKKQAFDLTEREKRLVQQSLKAQPPKNVFHHTFKGKLVRFGYFSDTHMGEKHFHEDLWRAMIATFRREGVVHVYCAGDIVEGMSGRPGHIYELAHIGYSAQLAYATKMFELGKGLQFHGILGNHDLWAKEKGDAGLNIGEELASRCDHFQYLGEWEADVILNGNCTLKLFHGNDGTAYADSYKIQKLIESFEGGKKPNIVLSGHYHKQIAIFRRNIFGFECGTLCGQTRFMRGKKLQAHKGFGIIEVWVGEHGVERLRHEFYPYYD